MLIDIPKDVSKAPCKYEPLKSVSLRSYNPVTKGHSGQIRKAVQLLLSAKRPISIPAAASSSRMRRVS